MLRATPLRTLTLLGCLALLFACSESDPRSESPIIGTGGQVATGGTGGTGGTEVPPGTGGEGAAATGGAGGGDSCVPGQATFTWLAPNQNTDGTCLTDLAGYALIYGPESANYTHRTEVPLDSAKCVETADEDECGFIQECSVTVVGLTPQLWFFVMIAIDEEGNESDYSNEVSKDLSCPDE